MCRQQNGLTSKQKRASQHRTHQLQTTMVPYDKQDKTTNVVEQLPIPSNHDSSDGYQECDVHARNRKCNKIGKLNSSKSLESSVTPRWCTASSDNLRRRILAKGLEFNRYDALLCLSVMWLLHAGQWKRCETNTCWLDVVSFSLTRLGWSTCSSLPGWVGGRLDDVIVWLSLCLVNVCVMVMRVIWR